MPTSPIQELFVSDSSTPKGYQCVIAVQNQKDEDTEIKLEKSHSHGCRVLRQHSRDHGQKSRRRNTFSHHQDYKTGKKRRRFTSITPPTKFLLGGNSSDPLNLNSLQDENIDHINNVFSPARSPMPMLARRNNVQVFVASNIHDPLNLNTDEDIAFNLLASKTRKRKRHRKGRKTSENANNTDVISPIEEKIPCLITSEKIEVPLLVPAKEPEESNIKQQVISNSISIQAVSNNDKNFHIESSSIQKADENEAKSNLRKQLLKQRKIHLRQDFLKFRKNAEKFCYGNHVTKNANWNFGDGQGKDQRLKLLDDKLFRNKIILDVGCNTGELSLYIARHLKPKTIVGIDIDKKLVIRAQKKLHLFYSNELQKNEEFPKCMASIYGPLSKLIAPTSQCLDSFPNNINFFEANYVPVSEDYLESQRPEYDTILCLRVTKWIHLNFGDEGLKLAFKRMFAQLRYGGALVLEPQPWFTYAPSKKITPAIYRTYQTLKLRPEKFCEYLLSNEVGFSSCQLIGRSFNCTKVYRHDIFLLRKGYDSTKQHLLMNNLSPIPYHYSSWTYDGYPNEELSKFEGENLTECFMH